MPESCKFSVLDVETANSDFGSICQIGIASFDGDLLIDSWGQLVDPELSFSTVHISKHGIDPATVRGKPRLCDIEHDIRRQLEGTVIVCHTMFDRTAVHRGFARYGIAPLQANWVDSSWAARCAWPDVAKSGYNLPNLCERLGHQYRAHDALEDAIAAGYVLLAAMRDSGLCLNELLAADEVEPTQPGRKPPRTWDDKGRVERTGACDGRLRGHVVVFTGDLLRMTRDEAADFAAAAGCDVRPGLTKRTTILVVGEQDFRLLRGHEKSSKHRKAEELNARGANIQILSEEAFFELVSRT